MSIKINDNFIVFTFTNGVGVNINGLWSFIYANQFKNLSTSVEGNLTQLLDKYAD